MCRGILNLNGSIIMILSSMLYQLTTLPKHMAYFILKKCFGVTKLIYTRRTTPTILFQENLQNMDKLIKLCLNNIYNMSLTNVQMKQANLLANLVWNTKLFGLKT